MRFVNAERYNRKVQGNKNDSVRNSPYDLNVTFQAMAPLIIMAAIGLGIWAAGNITSVTNEILMGESGVYDTVSIVAQIAAVSLTIIGLSIGKYCDLNHYSSVDDLTGYRTVKPTFWFGITFAFLYLTLHFFIAKYAMEASGIGSEYLLLIINVGIALFELVIGGLFLGQALLIISIWIMNIQLYFSRRKMNTSSARTDRHYSIYNTMRGAYNRQSGENMKQSGNPNIARAIALFNGLPERDGEEDERRSEGNNLQETIDSDEGERIKESQDESHGAPTQDESDVDDQQDDIGEVQADSEAQEPDEDSSIEIEDVEDEHEQRTRKNIDPDSNLTAD
jgi:hypothetical protein